MKLVGAAFGSRFVSRLASISCYSGFASTGYVREAPRVATRLDRGRSWSLPAPVAQTWDQCIEGFSFWAGDVRGGESLEGRVRKPGLCKDRSARICYTVALCRAKRWHKGTIFGRGSRRWRLKIFVSLHKRLACRQAESGTQWWKGFSTTYLHRNLAPLVRHRRPVRLAARNCPRRGMMSSRRRGVAS